MYDELNWRKPRRSFANGNCVEVADAARIVLVRDTEDRGGTVLAFGAGAWAEFTKGLQAGA